MKQPKKYEKLLAQMALRYPMIPIEAHIEPSFAVTN